MSIFHPTTGKVIDRLQVLTLKADFARRYGLPDEHFRREMAEIDAALVGKKAFMAENSGLIKELAEIHVQLWHHRGWFEAIRAANEANSVSIAQMAVNMTTLTARRHAIREQLDMASGEYQGPELVPLPKNRVQRNRGEL